MSRPSQKKPSKPRSAKPVAARPVPAARDGIAQVIARLDGIAVEAIAAANLDLAEKTLAKIGDLCLAMSREKRADERMVLQRARFEHSKTELDQLKAIESRIVAAEQRMSGVEQQERQHSPTADFLSTDTTAPAR